VATDGEDGIVHVLDVETGKEVARWQAHNADVTALTFNPDGTRPATASGDSTARLWDARTGQPIRECKGHTDIVWSVAFSPDGTWLATASEDKTARLWDAWTLPLPQGEELEYTGAVRFPPISKTVRAVCDQATLLTE
jgi:WD40 repeat protein